MTASDKRPRLQITCQRGGEAKDIAGLALALGNPLVEVNIATLPDAVGVIELAVGENGLILEELQPCGDGGIGSRGIGQRIMDHWFTGAERAEFS